MGKMPKNEEMEREGDNEDLLGSLHELHHDCVFRMREKKRSCL